MSFKPQVKVHGKWTTNGLVFTTKEEAAFAADELMSCWWLVEECRIIESDEAPNYQVIGKEIKFIKIGD